MWPALTGLFYFGEAYMEKVISVFKAVHTLEDNTKGIIQDHILGVDSGRLGAKSNLDRWEEDEDGKERT